MSDKIDDINAVYDFLELAESATTKKSALKYAKEVLKIESDNLDALSMVAELTCTSKENLSEKYRKLIEEADKKLKEQGYFDDYNIGEFWGLLETRPYMRLLLKYADNFVECGQFRLAIEEYKKMLKLCKRDNLGVRYNLMHLYAFFEDEHSALELLKKCPDDSTQFLLPLSILYYKLGNFRKANNYLKSLCNVNKDTYEFFDRMTDNRNFEEYIENMLPYGYSPCTMEEFIVELQQNDFLFSNMKSYFKWAKQKLNSKRGK